MLSNYATKQNFVTHEKNSIETSTSDGKEQGESDQARTSTGCKARTIARNIGQARTSTREHYH